MEEINLLQNRVKDTTFAWERQGRFVNGFLTFLFIMILGSAGLLYYLNSEVQTKLAETNDRAVTLQKQLDQKQQTVGDATVFQAQLANIRNLLGTHVNLSPVLDELSQNIYTQTQLVSLDVNEDSGKIHIEGIVPSYVDLGKLILGLSTSNRFEEVKLLSILPASGEINAYRFSIDLTAVPELFSSN